MLTSHQLNTLRHDLRMLAHIEYEEVENELLDHYATLTEQKMADGQTFEQASYLAWKALGEGAGLQKIQEDFVANIQQQVARRHWELVKSYFRWPAIVTTLLLCGLVYLLSHTLSYLGVYLMTSGLFVTPGLILLYAVFQKDHRHADARKIVWQYMNSRANLPMMFIQLTNIISASLDEEARSTAIYQSYPAVFMGLNCVLLVYGLTFLQLYREKFSYKTA
ncbi:hypothetical protein ACO2Q8_11895 [Larkinella sp. VNQ87]|uniref:hypothetical protein n=1 Tax=Larkinella sp. VNQ87 TaxID=3400921 RepID=UPI003C0961FF